MRSLTLLFTLCSAIAVLAEPIKAPHVATLVAQLGSTDYQEREVAFRTLDELGPAGLLDLRSAASSPDSEIARRATELVRRIEHRLTAAQRLAPSMVQVDIKNKTVFDAVKEFNQVTKIPIVIPKDVDKTKIKERRMSYKTNGPTPAWEALEQFLKVANLTEWDGITPTPTMPVPTVQTENGQMVQIAGRRGGVMFQTSNRPNAQPSKEICLYEGVPNTLPTMQSGAVRVRILPLTTPIPSMTPDTDELMIPVQVTLEPKLSWYSNPTVKHAQAVDHRGQKLTASVVGSTSNQNMYDEFGFNQMMWRGPIRLEQFLSIHSAATIFRFDFAVGRSRTRRLRN